MTGSSLIPHLNKSAAGVAGKHQKSTGIPNLLFFDSPSSVSDLGRWDDGRDHLLKKKLNTLVTFAVVAGIGKSIGAIEASLLRFSLHRSLSDQLRPPLPSPCWGAHKETIPASWNGRMEETGRWCRGRGGKRVVRILSQSDTTLSDYI
jgi:hypothetical protein